VRSSKYSIPRRRRPVLPQSIKDLHHATYYIEPKTQIWFLFYVNYIKYTPVHKSGHCTFLVVCYFSTNGRTIHFCNTLIWPVAVPIKLSIKREKIGVFTTPLSATFPRQRVDDGKWKVLNCYIMPIRILCIDWYSILTAVLWLRRLRRQNSRGGRISSDI